MADKLGQQKQTTERAPEFRLFGSITALRQLSLDELSNRMAACDLVRALIWREIHEREMAESELFPMEVS